MVAMTDTAREWAREHLTGIALAGVLLALDQIPDHMVPRVQLDSQSPWASVDAIPSPQLAVWLLNGDVYEVGEDGAVSDEPIATIERMNQNQVSQEARPDGSHSVVQKRGSSSRSVD